MAIPYRSPAFACTVILLIAFVTCPGHAGSVPRITGLFPPGGIVDGGTVVAIAGSGFSGATEVRFGDTPATVFTVVSDTGITATTPPNPAGSVFVSVTNPDGTGRSGDPSTMYQYEEILLPRISGVIPPSGPASGNSEVMITGSGLYGTEIVRFGGKTAWIEKIVDDSHIIVRTPPSSPGDVTILVKNAAGVGSSEALAVSYHYDYPIPVLLSISPTTGFTTGGTVVTVNGSGFGGATEVRFGDKPGPAVTVIDDTLLRVVAPPNTAGTVSLTVINPVHSGGSQGAAAIFRYRIPIPELTGISPAEGGVEGGTVVNLTGSGFTGTKEIRFGGKAGMDVTVINDTHASAVTPPSSLRSVPVEIENAHGTGGTLGPSTMFRYVVSTTVTTTTAPAVHQTTQPPDTTASALPSAMATPPAAAAPATTHAPGFCTFAGLCALGAAVLGRKAGP